MHHGSNDSPISLHCTKEFSAKFQCFAIVLPVPRKKYKDKSKNILSQPVPNYVQRHQQCDLHVAVQPNARVLEPSQSFTKCFIKTDLTGSAEKQSKQTPHNGLGFVTLWPQSESLNPGYMGALILVEQYKLSTLKLHTTNKSKNDIIKPFLLCTLPRQKMRHLSCRCVARAPPTPAHARARTGRQGCGGKGWREWMGLIYIQYRLKFDLL